MTKNVVLALFAIMSSSFAFTPQRFSSQHIRIAPKNENTVKPLVIRIVPMTKSNLSHKRSTSMKLSMTGASEIVTTASLVGVISGGLLGGALHAIAGEFFLIDSV